MVDKKISELSILADPVTGDLIPVIDISEAADIDKNKYLTWGAWETAFIQPGSASHDGFSDYVADEHLASSTFATALQGIKADGALQPGASLDELDVSYNLPTDDDIMVWKVAQWETAAGPENFGSWVGRGVIDEDDLVSDLNYKVPTQQSVKAYVDNYTPPAASTTVAGIIELATQAEVDAGTDVDRAITPATLTNFSGFPTGGLTVVYKVANYTIVAGEFVLIDSGGTDRTITAPATIAANDRFAVHHFNTSGTPATVTVARNSHTLRYQGDTNGKAGGAATDITLSDGQTVHFIASDSTNLEIV